MSTKVSCSARCSSNFRLANINVPFACGGVVEGVDEGALAMVAVAYDQNFNGPFVFFQGFPPFGIQSAVVLTHPSCLACVRLSCLLFFYFLFSLLSFFPQSCSKG